MTKTIALLLALTACGGTPKATTAAPANNGTDPVVKAPDGSGTAKVVTRNTEGGVIEYLGDRGKAMDEGQKHMSAHCGPSNYQIISEGEEVVDDGKRDTIWRVHYVCSSAP